MPDFAFVLLYVANPPKSAEFYAALLGRPPVETSPTFAMLPLRDGVMLGLWSREKVEPEAGSVGTDGEVAFTVADAAAVRSVHGEWSGAASRSPRRRPRWTSAPPSSRSIRTAIGSASSPLPGERDRMPLPRGREGA